MSDWHLIPTRSLQEIENLASEIFDNNDSEDLMKFADEIKALVNEAVPCNVKPESVK